jgi:hypothetical protein
MYRKTPDQVPGTAFGFCTLTTALPSPEGAVKVSVV